MENNDNIEHDFEAANFYIDDAEEETILNAPIDNIASVKECNDVPSKVNIDRKLFIGGLNKDTTESEMRNYFSSYGNIESIVIKPYRGAGKSKGFAFIVFETAEAVNKIKAVGNHVLNEEPIDVQIAKTKHSKIFINLPNELEEEDVKTYFSQFGNIIKIDTPCDKETNERRGFCVITYDSIEAVDALVKTPIHIINGKEVSIQKSPFLGSESANRGKKIGRKQNSDSSRIVRGMQSKGKVMVQQRKEFGHRKNVIRQNFKGRNFPNPNVQTQESNNFVEQTFDGSQNFDGRRNFDRRQNFGGAQNFNRRQNFDSRQNFDGQQNFDGRQNINDGPNVDIAHSFDRRQNFNGRSNGRGRQNFDTKQTYGNRQHIVRPTPFVGQRPVDEQYHFSGTQRNTSFGRQNPTNERPFERRQNIANNVTKNVQRQNFHSQQTSAQFLPTQVSNENNFDFQNFNSQNLGSQNASNQHYFNNQGYGGNSNYQEGYWGAYSGGNVGHPHSGTNKNFGNRHTAENNTGYYNNNTGRENVNDPFAFANNRQPRQPGSENIRGDMRKGAGRGATWTGFNGNINPNDNQRYQPY